MMRLSTSEKPSTYVRLINTEDGGALLDIRHNRCLGMTPTGSHIWNLLTKGHSMDQIVNEISTRYEVPRGQVHEDVQQYLIKLREKGLLEENRRDPDFHFTWAFWILRIRKKLFSHSSDASIGFLTHQAFVGLLLFDVCGLGTHFEAMHELVSKWPIRPALHKPPVDRVTSALNHASVWYPKRVLCLQRSVVLTCLLRDFGIAAKMVMGVQRFPLKAHAWCEIDGHAINERRDVASIYQVWERC